MATATRTLPPTERIPPLEDGDHLTAAEFERRYQAMPGIKAELIGGIVYVASPVSDDHGQPHAQMIFWLGCYFMATPGVAFSDNGTLRLDREDRSQPDAHLRILPECGGRTRLSDDRYVIGGPELVLEVALSSAAFDLHQKLGAYLRNEIPEYVVWRVEDRAIDWFVLRDGRYERLEPAAGLLRSLVFPGLWLDSAALIRGDLAAVHLATQAGIATPEHAAFVARLQEHAVEGRRP